MWWQRAWAISGEIAAGSSSWVNNRHTPPPSACWPCLCMHGLGRMRGSDAHGGCVEGNAGRFVDWLSDSGRRHINPTAGITHGAERNQDEMIPLGQAHLERVLLAVLAVLHLSAASTADLATTAAPDGSNSTLPGDDEGAKVVHPYTPCGSDYAHYCGNGGQCIFPQDTDKPSCICTSSFKGERCLTFSDHSHTLPELEQLVAISLGLGMLVVALAVIALCILRRRCVKSAPLIKSASDSSV